MISKCFQIRPSSSPLTPWMYNKTRGLTYETAQKVLFNTVRTQVPQQKPCSLYAWNLLYYKTKKSFFQHWRTNLTLVSQVEFFFTWRMGPLLPLVAVGGKNSQCSSLQRSQWLCCAHRPQGAVLSPLQFCTSQRKNPAALENLLGQTTQICPFSEVFSNNIFWLLGKIDEDWLIFKCTSG